MMHESAKMIEVVSALIKVAEDLVEGKRSPQDRLDDAKAVLAQIPILWPRREYDMAAAVRTYEEMQYRNEQYRITPKVTRPTAEVEEEYGLPKGYLNPEGDDDGS